MSCQNISLIVVMSQHVVHIVISILFTCRNVFSEAQTRRKSFNLFHHVRHFHVFLWVLYFGTSRNVSVDWFGEINYLFDDNLSSIEDESKYCNWILDIITEKDINGCVKFLNWKSNCIVHVSFPKPEREA